jgi:glycosyltransferase involved in cell wall biosynthesis
MKIVFMTSGTINSSISYRPLALARELIKKGHELYILAPRFDKYSNFKDEGITNVDGITIIRPWQVKTFSFELGLIPYIISSALNLYKLNPDIIHVNKPNPITLPSLIAKIARKTPIILDVDDADSEVMKIEQNSKLKIKLVELSENILANQATAITTASKFLRDSYSSKYKNKLVIHIPNGAEFTNIEKKLINKISNRIVFIGAMNRKNILEPLFHSLKELQNKKIKTNSIIIGDGKFLNYFKKLSKTLGITNKTKFLGWIPQNSLSKYIRVGDIGYAYMPNELTIKACSSMKVFQYMQYGAIPLVSNVGDFPSYTFNGKAGYIAKHSDIKSLVETLNIALNTKNDNINKIKYSQHNAKNKFSWEILANKVEKLYINIK